MTLSNAQIQKDIKDVKEHVFRNSTNQQPYSPTVSAVIDPLLSATLAEDFIRGAEAFQPWNKIGIDQWISGGRWWLLRVSACQICELIAFSSI